MKFLPKALRREFSFDNLRMKHDTQRHFFTTQWQTCREISIYYMSYRILMALIFCVSLVLSIIDIDNLDESEVSRAKWLIYLTHWGYAACTIQSLISCYLIVYTYLLNKKRSELVTSEPIILNKRLLAVYWVLFTIATDAAFGITCIYWSLIYDGTQMPVTTMNVFVHGINSVLMMIDLWMVGHPVRILHCYWSFLFGLSYIIFNAIYYLAGGLDKRGKHYIYPILDWEKPGSSVLVGFLALMFLIFLHLLTYGIYLLRSHIFENCCNNKQSDDGTFTVRIEIKGDTPNATSNKDFTEYF